MSVRFANLFRPSLTTQSRLELMEMSTDRQADTPSMKIVIPIFNLVVIVMAKTLQKMLSRSIWMNFVQLKIVPQEVLSLQETPRYQKVTNSNFLCRSCSFVHEPSLISVFSWKFSSRTYHQPSNAHHFSGPTALSCLQQRFWYSSSRLLSSQNCWCRVLQSLWLGTLRLWTCVPPHQ